MIAAALALLWLAASPVITFGGAPASSPIGGRVPFTLVAHSPGLRPGLARASPSAGLLRPGHPYGRDESVSPSTAPRPEGKKLRAWLELASFSTATTVNYWISNSFPEDRDFGINFHDQFSRIFLLEGWRFDSNQFSLNWSHILGGAVYYQFGRTSDLSWLYAWAMSVAGSTWWEVIGEPKEAIAVNDQIMTGLGGFAAGEPWYQIGHYLSHQPGLLQRALSFLNPVVKFNHWLDRNEAAGATATDPAEAGWHDFSLFAGARRITTAGGEAAGEAATDAYFGFHARLLGIADYGTSGETRRAVKDPYFSEMSLDYAARGGHAEETRFFSKAVTWGRFVQKIDASGRGYALILGIGSAFELFKKRPVAEYDANPVPVKTDLARLHLEEPRRFTDKLAILHLAGPVLDLSLFRRDFRLRTVLEAYGDFALVNAYALGDFSRVHDIAGLKTVVFYYGYYYGFGGTLSASARLDWKGFTVHGLARFSAWSSADVLDRFQDEVTNNAHLTDGRARYLVGTAWKVPGTPFELFVEIEGVRRRGRLAEVRAEGLEKKAYAGLAFSF